MRWITHLSAGAGDRAFTVEKYFRTSVQYELDLVLGIEGERPAIEVKLTASLGPADMGRLGKPPT